MIDEILAGAKAAQADVRKAQSKALADLIVRLINDNEPLLRARRMDGAQVMVEEKGGPGRYTFAVVPSVPAAGG